MELSAEVETLLAGVTEAFQPDPPPPAEVAHAQEPTAEIVTGPPVGAKWLFESVRLLDSMAETLNDVQSAWAKVEARQSTALAGAEAAAVAVHSKQKDMECFISAVRQRIAVFDTYDRVIEEVGDDPQRFVLGLALASFNEGLHITAAENYRAEALAAVLQKVDDACAFLQFHKDYADSKSARAKINELRDKLLFAVRSVVTQTLERIEQQTMKKAEAERAEGRPLHFPSLYARFRAAGNHLRALTAVLADCESATGEESYKICLDLIEGVYAATRMRLVLDAFKAHMSAVLSQRLGTSGEDDALSDVSIAIRQCSTLALSVAQLELQSFRSFFIPRGESPALAALLGALGDSFANLLRPVVLRCSRPAVLREIVECLAIDSREVTAAQQSVRYLAPIWTAVYRLRADAQERLLFRTEAVLWQGIRGFTPEPADLDYPTKLFVKPLDFNCTVRTAESPMAHSYVPAEPRTQQHGQAQLRGSDAWYPPAVVLAECLCNASCLAAGTAFQSLAQAGVESCISSLTDAARKIQATKGSAFDSCLFLVKHLLVLREQVMEFKCDLVSDEIIFSFASVRDRLAEGRSGEGSPSSSSRQLLNIFVPQLDVARVDTKRDFELALKQNCEEFVAHSAALLLLPLLKLCGEVSKMQRNGDAIMKAQIGDSINAFQLNVQNDLPCLVFNTVAYLHCVSFASAEDYTAGKGVWLQLPVVDIQRARERTPPKSHTNTPAGILLNAVRGAVTDAVRHVRGVLLETPTKTGDTVEPPLQSIEALEQEFGWWSVTLLHSIFDWVIFDVNMTS